MEVAGYLLHHHLRHDIERGEASIGEALLVLSHLDGLQPLVHCVKAGVVRDRPVQQWQVDSGGGVGNRDSQGTCGHGGEGKDGDRHICGLQVYLHICIH